ncbi:putative reverse transcriptase domain-containing protein [Tanacetum coccineum]
MLRAFHMSLTRADSRWLRNEPSGSIQTWGALKKRFLPKYCPPARTAKKMKEINNFQQEPHETLYLAWERFKDLCYTIYEMADHSQKWHDGTSTRTRSTDTSDGLASIQAQLSNLGREIKKVNEKVYAAQVGCELFSFPGGRFRATAPGFYQRDNRNNSYQERRQTVEESLKSLMAESSKRHDDNSNLIKKIQSSTDATNRNQGASIKALGIQIGRLYAGDYEDLKELNDVKGLEACSTQPKLLNDSLP